MPVEYLTLWIRRAPPTPPRDNYQPTEDEGNLLLPLESDGFSATWVTGLKPAILRSQYGHLVVPVNSYMNGMRYRDALAIRRGAVQARISEAPDQAALTGQTGVIGAVRAGEAADQSVCIGAGGPSVRVGIGEACDGVAIAGVSGWVWTTPVVVQAVDHRARWRRPVILVDVRPPIYIKRSREGFRTKGLVRGDKGMGTWMRRRPWPNVEWNDDLDLGAST